MLFLHFRMATGKYLCQYFGCNREVTLGKKILGRAFSQETFGCNHHRKKVLMSGLFVKNHFRAVDSCKVGFRVAKNFREDTSIGVLMISYPPVCRNPCNRSIRMLYSRLKHYSGNTMKSGLICKRSKFSS